MPLNISAAKLTLEISVTMPAMAPASRIEKNLSVVIVLMECIDSARKVWILLLRKYDGG